MSIIELNQIPKWLEAVRKLQVWYQRFDRGKCPDYYEQASGQGCPFCLLAKSYNSSRIRSDCRACIWMHFEGCHCGGRFKCEKIRKDFREENTQERLDRLHRWESKLHEMMLEGVMEEINNVC